MWTLHCDGRVVPLAPGRHVLGRSTECEISLDDQLVSRRHAELIVEGERVILRDLESRNGVLHAYRRVPPGAEIELADGATFVVGGTNLLLRRAGSGVQRRMRTVEIAPHPTGFEGSTAAPVLYEKFLSEAERSLERGDIDRCATATHLLLESLGGALRSGLPPETPAIEKSSRLALQLAELRGVEWVDLMLAMFGESSLVLSVHAITTLQRLFEERDWRSAELERYVARVRPVLDGTGPRASALLMQLDGLLRRQRSA